MLVSKVIVLYEASSYQDFTAHSGIPTTKYLRIEDTYEMMLSIAKMEATLKCSQSQCRQRILGCAQVMPRECERSG